jgi:hypothetical protein
VFSAPAILGHYLRRRQTRRAVLTIQGFLTPLAHGYLLLLSRELCLLLSRQGFFWLRMLVNGLLL